MADGSGNIAPHPHYSSTTHMESQTLPTHSVLFLSLLIQTIFAMGRCCSLSTRLYIQYISCTSTKCRLCTTLVFSHPLLPHNPPPSYLHPADLKQMGPPLCAVVLLKVPS